jgi:phosphoribosylformylglycinamidine cyclo-ligase
MAESLYAQAGVDTAQASRAVDSLLKTLRAAFRPHETQALLSWGHYANVLPLDARTGVALSTDGVGSKAIVAEQLDRFETIGIDCVAMNANDVICVGAKPTAMVDYISVARADEEQLAAIGHGLARGAIQADIEIPAGEVAQLPEMVRSHGPHDRGFDLVGACIGIVALDRMVIGDRVQPGDLVVGLPSSGVHANGLTLARRALPDLSERPPELDGQTVGDALLEPTTLYVRAIHTLLESRIDVRGLAHITSDSFRNLLRLEARVGYRIEAPLPVLPVFELIAQRSGTGEPEMWEVFNMGCGFCVVVPPVDADRCVELLDALHPGAAVLGHATEETGIVRIADRGLVGSKAEVFRWA